MFLQALIFDVDGTIADTERNGHRVAFNRAFAAAGLAWNWDTTMYGTLLEVAGGKERIQHYLETHDPALPPAADIQAWSLDLHRAKSQHYKQLLQEGIIPLRPGVRRLMLQARQAGIRLAIATTSKLDNVVALLETALAPDSPAWFEVIAAGDVVPEKKPAPDIYHYVLSAMQLPPSACLAIEDSYQGLQAARQAGIPTVITFNDYTRQHEFTGALLVLDHLGEPNLACRVIAGAPISRTHFDLDLAQTLVTLSAPSAIG